MCVCVAPERGPLMGKLMAFRQWRPAQGMEGRRKKRHRVSECVCESVCVGKGSDNI